MPNRPDQPSKYPLHRINVQPSFIGRRRRLDFYVFEAEGGFVYWGLPTLENLAEYEETDKVSLSLPYDDGQQIIDELWRLGFRPSPNMTKDVSNRDMHLSDLRKLVSKAYKVEL